MKSREFIFLQIELTRHVCHAIPTQSFTSHSLKRLKLLAILGSVLILWAGFNCSVYAARMMKRDAANHTTPTNYIYPQPEGGDASGAERASQDACEDYCKNASAYFENVTFTCIGGYTGGSMGYQYNVKNHITGFDQNTSRTFAFSYSFDRTEDCTETTPFNPATGRCDPNYTPPPPPSPPEKNFGNPPDCPSPFVASETK